MRSCLLPKDCNQTEREETETRTMINLSGDMSTLLAERRCSESTAEAAPEIGQRVAWSEFTQPWWVIMYRPVAGRVSSSGNSYWRTPVFKCKIPTGEKQWRSNLRPAVVFAMRTKCYSVRNYNLSINHDVGLQDYHIRAKKPEELYFKYGVVPHNSDSSVEISLMTRCCVI